MIHYRTYGHGYPILLLHGFGEDGDVWEYPAKQLASRFRVCVPDIPGSGKSPMLPADAFGEAITISSLAKAMWGLLDSLGVDRTVVIGHSMGGYITLAMAEQRADRLDGFGLFHSTAYPDSEERKQTRERSIRIIRERGSLTFLRESVPNWFSESFRNRHPEIVEEIIDSGKQFDPQALVMYTEAMKERPDRREVLKRASVPVLLVAGEQDKTVLLEDILKQSHLAADTDFYILKDAAHMGMLETPEQTADILMKYLNQLKRSE